MDEHSNFYTMKGYQNLSGNELTPSTEDYLEMIYRLLITNKVVRINELAKNLNVKPSSATKTVQALKELGYIDYEKYGYISLTEKGETEAQYLFFRHNVLEKFLCLINNSENELEQVELIEHFLTKETVSNINKLNDFLSHNSLPIFD